MYIKLFKPDFITNKHRDMEETGMVRTLLSAGYDLMGSA